MVDPTNTLLLPTNNNNIREMWSAHPASISHSTTNIKHQTALDTAAFLKSTKKK